MGAPSFCPKHLIVQRQRIISYHHSIKRRSYNNAECEGAPTQPLSERQFCVKASQIFRSRLFVTVASSHDRSNVKAL